MNKNKNNITNNININNGKIMKKMMKKKLINFVKISVKDWFVRMMVMVKPTETANWLSFEWNVARLFEFIGVMQYMVDSYWFKWLLAFFEI